MKNVFDANRGAIERIVKKYRDYPEKIKADIANKIKAVTSMTYQIATSRREMIGKKGHKVSNPDASFGVPVQTGNLQASIKKNVTESVDGLSVTGMIWVDIGQAPYALFVERGTSRMKARPFIRPAHEATKDIIRKVFHE